MRQSTLVQIRTQVERMRALAQSPELSACNERVSAWSPAEHLDHLVKVSTSIVRRLTKEGVAPLPNGISAAGRAVLLLGWIPRGRGKAPERVSGARATAEEIEAALAKLEQAFEALPFDTLRAARAPIVPHPKFGGLTPAQALRFIEVHTEHHLKIVADICGVRR